MNLEQVTMLHCDMVKHISCNPLGANGAGLKMKVTMKMRTDESTANSLTVPH